MMKVVLLGSLCFALTAHAEEELLSAKDIFTEEATIPSETNDSAKKKNKSTQTKKPKASEEDASSPSMLKPKGAKDPYESP